MTAQRSVTAQRIDAHMHFWRYSATEYAWIDERMRELQRDFLPPAAALEIATAGVAGVVAVQAQQTLAETAWLLQLAEQFSFIRGVVGWADLRSEQLAKQLPDSPVLAGIRHIVQAESSGFLELAELNRGISELTARDLSYDLLIHAQQLRESQAFVDRHPKQRFVLDHLAKPPIARGELQPWAAELSELARRPNVWAKLSGLVTEAHWASWSAADLRPYLDVAWHAFGPSRLLFGSDYPVCRLAAGYSSVSSVITDFLAEASASERESVLGGNALSVYRLRA